ncbi:hypothetical protein FGIG_06610 [Fasciola gigantica]|uniref:TLDc domain-containing protein n=1 Tax=Fasciola gigantica TaxID=46835 RepID=A0A504YF97_FASGI|nr:hypothetical protein FGIG_06610 [Fasciola gigantica]
MMLSSVTLLSVLTKLLYLVNLFDTNEFSHNDVRVLVSWLSFGHEFGENFRNAIFKPVLSLQTPVQKEDVYSRLRTTFSDYAEDLARIVLVSLTTGEPVSTAFEASSEFTDLLNLDVLRILGLFLSSPYKRPNPTRLGNIAPLEVEQLTHMHCLFNSKMHGFSITRIKELAFDYDGPIILLIKADNFLFCIASDQGLKDTFKPYGAENSCLLQILPETARLVSGSSSKKTDFGAQNGIIYSNFTLKTSRRGLLVGHQPLVSPAIEIDEGFTTLQFASSHPMKLTAAEIWAAGPTSQLDKLTAQKAWELEQVMKAKNRKIKPDEDWRESVDRQLLDMAGVRVRRSDVIEGYKPKEDI